jgi:hypothetical protein
MGFTTAPIILGIDATPSGGACLLRGDEIVVAIQEERLSRVEGDPIRASLPFLALSYCLGAAGVEPGDVDLVVCRSDGPSAEWPHDVTLNPMLQVAHRRLAWMAIEAHEAFPGRQASPGHVASSGHGASLGHEASSGRLAAAVHEPDAGVTVARRGLEEKFPEAGTGALRGRPMGRNYADAEVLEAIAGVPGIAATHRGEGVVDAAAEKLHAGEAVAWFEGPSVVRPGVGGRVILSERGWKPLPSSLDRQRTFVPFADELGPQRTRLRRLLARLIEGPMEPTVYGAPFRAAREPIAETPADALWTFLHLELDACVLDDYLVERRGALRSLLDLVPTLNDVECAISGGCRPEAIDGGWATRRVAAEVTTPWGATSRVLHPLQLALLSAIDGGSTGWQLLEQLGARRRSRIDAHRLRDGLAELRRLGLVSLADPESGAPSAAGGR